jgi:NACHT N-terminal Helical domain 1
MVGCLRRSPRHPCAYCQPNSQGKSGQHLVPDVRDYIAKPTSAAPPFAAFGREGQFLSGPSEGCEIRSTAPEQRILGVAVSDLTSFSHEFRGLDDGEREAALQAVQKAFGREDLTDRALFAADIDPAKLARRLRAGQPGAKTDAWLSEAGGAFYDAALHRCCARRGGWYPTSSSRSCAWPGSARRTPA